MDNAITVRDISKIYRVYDTPKARLKELLSLTNKKYYREFEALGGVTFDVGRGESVGIIGKNGSGKSTLLKIICGISSPSSGSVHAAGRISALLELGTGFNPEFTGRENVYLNGALMGYTKEEMDARYEAIVRFADIGDFINQPIKKYSTGMQVRLGFACAVNVEPEILVVDEALSVGDVFFQQKCFRKMAEFKEQGKTLLLVTHSMDTVQKYCDRAVLLEAGRATSIGKSRDVINDYYESVLSRGKPDLSVDDGAAEKEPPTEAPARGPGAPGVRDRCGDRPNYNVNEFRYGNLKASIVDFVMLDEDGNETTTVFSGGNLRFRYEILFSEPVDTPVYGLIIKTIHGGVVYVNNTWYEDMDVAPGDRGDRVSVEFAQNVNLGAGDYFLSAGIAELVGGEIEPVDRRYDLAHLKVMPVDKSAGVVNLFSRIGVHKGALGDMGTG